MADNLSVSTIVNSQRQVVGLEANLSDSSNDSFNIVGVPGVVYNLSAIPTGPGTSNATVTSVEMNFDPAEQQYANLLNTSMQSSLPSVTLTNNQVVNITDISGNTMSILGSINTAYDLNLLTYLYAIVSAMDLFMSMQFGASYEQVKHERLALVNLE